MRPIRLSTEHLELLKAQVDTMLNTYKADENLTLKLDASVVTANIPKPIVYITASAYVKMTYLIHNCDKELAWHGTVEKINNNYLIEDILVYPQTVTSTTVDSDDTKYPQWCMNLNDETINKLRFQGHSHVNMGTSPSGRDTTNWKNFLNILQENEFYIFCIGNKKGDYYWTIYDNAINVMFENKDISWMVVDETGNDIAAWSKEQLKTHITEQKPVTVIGTHNTIEHFTQSFLDEKPSKRPVLDSDLIPIGLQGLGIVDFDPQEDMYYSYSYITGFKWNHRYQCYSMEGEDCRERYGNPKKEKKKRGRPAKGENSK
jgi:hypothetical protein